MQFGLQANTQMAGAAWAGNAATGDARAELPPASSSFWLPQILAYAEISPYQWLHGLSKTELKTTCFVPFPKREPRTVYSQVVQVIVL